MLKSYKSNLQLNSYKLDTKGYEEKLREITIENEQLKAIIHSCKSKENQLYEQLKNAKLQNNTLRNKLRNDFVVHENRCKNCTTFTQQSIDRLTAQLEAERIKTKQYRDMYENETHNKKQLTEYYEKKLHSLLRDKDILIKKYEEKIKMTTSQNSFPTSPQFQSSTSIQNHFSPSKPQQNQIQSYQTQPMVDARDSQTDKFIKKYPPSPPKANNFKPAFQSQQQVATARRVSQASLTNLLMPILQRLKKMQISFEQLKCIPQVQRFSQSANPQKTRYIKLLRDFPFECQSQDEIEQSYEYIVSFLLQEGMQYSGSNIMRVIIGKMSVL